MARTLKNVSKISGIHGQPGEEKVAYELASNLPDSYVILNSPRIYYKGETVDIDHIVIGPNGIFAIESKNMLGKINGGLMGNWVQEKRRAGKKLKIKIGNPANQVNQYTKIIHTFLLAQYRKKSLTRINIKIKPIVAFAFENIDLTHLEYNEPGMIGQVRVLLLKDLCNYILSFQENCYTAAEIEQIANIIIPAEQRDQTGIFASFEITGIKDKFGDRYELYEEIGRGNFAAVYRGFDFKLDREVAVKKLFTNKEDTNTVKRFYREAQIASKLQHDHIVNIYDFYEEDGEFYLIMEFIEGATLHDFMKSHTLTNNEIYEFMINICSAIQHAHDLNIIHRDLKPANILISLENKVKVTDFGIARLNEAPMLTQTHTTLGTPATMAPEQIMGKDVDNRTDIFALGVMMYLIFTGQYPFAGEHIGEVIHKIINFDPALPSSLNSNIPALAEKIILKALEKEPENRFQTVDEMKLAIMYVVDPSLVQDHSISSLFKTRNKNSWLKILTQKFSLFRHNKRSRFMAVVIITFLIFGGLFITQSYVDSQNAGKPIVNQIVGFNNDNISLYFENPTKYEQLPANLVGKLDKVVSVSQDTVLFNLSIQPTNGSKKESILVKVNGDHSIIANLHFMRVLGNTITEINPTSKDKNTVKPLIIADGIVPIDKPWTIFAPTTNSLVINKTIDHSGGLVTLKKIEFAKDETRLFVNVKNNTSKVVQFNLENPRAKQSNKQFHEFVNKYGVYSRDKFGLEPGNEIAEVIILEPLNIRASKATITLGNKSPFTFSLTW